MTYCASVFGVPLTLCCNVTQWYTETKPVQFVGSTELCFTVGIFPEKKYTNCNETYLMKLLNLCIVCFSPFALGGLWTSSSH